MILWKTSIYGLHFIDVTIFRVKHIKDLYLIHMKYAESNSFIFDLLRVYFW